MSDRREFLASNRLAEPNYWLMPQKPQRQDSLADQLRDVRILANRYGCYDAADWIGRQLGDSYPTRP